MKKNLVLISGLLSDQRVWQHQSRHLDDIASIHIVSPSQETPEKMVQEILDRAPPQFALAGHSMGGWLALEVMRTAPERVSQLCLLNTTSRGDSKEKLMKRQQMIHRAEQGEFSQIIQELSGFFVFNESVKEGVRQMFLSVGAEAFIRQEKAMLIRKESLSILPKIACPTLVIHASQNKIFSFEEHQELTSQIPQARCAVIEDTGHMSPMESPQAVTAFLRYWLTYWGC